MHFSRKINPIGFDRGQEISEVTGAENMVSLKTLVNAISQDSNNGHFSHLLYNFIILGEIVLLFTVEVGSHLRLLEVKNRKA